MYVRGDGGANDQHYSKLLSITLILLGHVLTGHTDRVLYSSLTQQDHNGRKKIPDQRQKIETWDARAKHRVSLCGSKKCAQIKFQLYLLVLPLPSLLFVFLRN